MTKGQRAMAVAVIYPEPEKGGRGKTIPKPDGISKQRISVARTVLHYAPDLVDGVLAGATSLDDACKMARQRRDEAESVDKQLARLRERNPDPRVDRITAFDRYADRG